MTSTISDLKPRRSQVGLRAVRSAVNLKPGRQPFQRYQLEPYRESQAAGEQILVAARAELSDAGEDGKGDERFASFST